MNTEKPIPAEISFSGNSTVIAIRVENFGEGIELTQKIADSTLQLHYVDTVNNEMQILIQPEHPRLSAVFKKQHSKLTIQQRELAEETD